MLQVDFANEWIGGGVLRSGCVQEEILFLNAPSLLCSRLFCPRLRPRESLLMLGFNRISIGSGYGRTWEFSGDYISSKPPSNKPLQMIAIDAIPFSNLRSQYKLYNVCRELIKAMSGFLPAGFGIDNTLGSKIQNLPVASNLFFAYFILFSWKLGLRCIRRQS